MLVSVSSAQRPVGDLVAERPGRAWLLEQLGIDYCCGGRRTLAEVCEERGLDAATVGVLLDTTGSDRGLIGSDWGRAPLPQLCDHIVDVHHAYLHRELPRIGDLLAMCERALGDQRPEIHEIVATFEELRVELEQHLADEERTLFPACRKLGGRRASLDPSLPDALERFAAEHTGTGSSLRRLSALTDCYDIRNGRCDTHRAAIRGLAELERDLHEHIHEENNLLFPRVLAMVER